MMEYIEGSEVYIGEKRLVDYTKNETLEKDESSVVSLITELDNKEVLKALSGDTKTNYKFLLGGDAIEGDFLGPKITVSDERYVWFGFIKRNPCSKMRTYDTDYSSKRLTYEPGYTLSQIDIDYLLQKWNEQYMEADYIVRKNNRIKNHFLASIGRFENYKDHFIFKSEGVIVANLSVKYFFYPIAQAECSAIHMWVDQFMLSREERIFIHSKFKEEVDRINELAQMFCGISYENSRALGASKSYGFVPYFLESKYYV